MRFPPVSKRIAIFVDASAFWVIVLLAYGVVGFLRGRGLVRTFWAWIRPGEDPDW